MNTNYLSTVHLGYEVSAKQRWQWTLMDIEDVAALLPAITPNDTPKETLLWRSLLAFSKILS
jgi:hypothetical protein